MNNTINSLTTKNLPNSPEVKTIFEYNSYKPVSESSKEGVNQDFTSTNFVADGIGSVEDSQVHSQAAGQIYDKIFGKNIVPLPKNVLDTKIKAFNLQIKLYCEANNLKKLKTTITFVAPYMENGQNKLCMLSQGDSIVFGHTYEGQCKQLTLNSHPLFKNISEQSTPELTNFAIQIQQIARDNRILNNDNPSQAVKKSMLEISDIINDDQVFEKFVESSVMSCQKMLPKKSQLDAMSDRLNDLQIERLTEENNENKKEISSLEKSLNLASILQTFIETEDLQYMILGYMESINVVSDFQTITYADSSGYPAVFVASDGLQDNIDTTTMEKILNDPEISYEEKNIEMVGAAVNSKIKPDNISSVMMSIEQK
jgi:serine/threonine protein phosphatase PrpC